MLKSLLNAARFSKFLNKARQGAVILALLFFASCASAAPVKNIQPQINSLVVAQHFDRAVQFLDEGPSSYGTHNELLYWLDKGMVLQLAGRYHESVGAFENAKRLYDDLYGHSLGEVAGAVLINDYWKQYRGEDFEYVLLNAFQSLNFAAMGQIDESLADMRKVDLQLKLINNRYNEKNKNVYRDDAFVRLLAGIFYEAEGSLASLNDAFIANVKALEIYEGEYQRNYKTALPKLLTMNVLTSAALMGEDQYRTYKAKFTDQPLVKVEGKRNKAEVYLIEYVGYVPLKVADAFLIPLDTSHLTKISFPKYNDRFSEVKSSVFLAKSNGVEINMPTELVEDIGAIAKQVLESRKVMMMAQAAIRPLGKYVMEKTVEGAARKQGGELAADMVTVLSNVYNFATEEADVRSWQTLPNEIHMARVLLDPGTYELSVNDLNDSKVLVESRSLGKFVLKAGEKKFLISRGYR